MKHHPILCVAALALAACSSEPEVDMKNASVGDVINEVQKSGVSQDAVRPGNWETKVTVDDIIMPGVPPSVLAGMKDVMGRQLNVTIEHCVTPEEAKKPGSDFFTGKKSDDCRYEHFTMGDGKVDAVMRCQGNRAGLMTMKMAGTFTPESSSTRSEMEVNQASNGDAGIMTIKARTETRRIGECDGKAN